MTKIKIFLSKTKSAFKQSFVRPNKKLSIVFVAIFVLSVFYPTDGSFYEKRRYPDANKFIYITEDYLRFVPTIAQIALPIIMRDGIGAFQAINVGLLTTISTHLFKRGFDDIEINGRKLGLRPRGGGQNMPSGHSSMIGSATAFVAIRYGLKWLILFVPLTIFTMYARFMLDAHTISATFAGVALGVLCALFASGNK